MSLSKSNVGIQTIVYIFLKHAVPLNTVKYDVDQELMINYAKLWIVQSWFFNRLQIFFIFGQIWKYLVFLYSDSTCLINKNIWIFEYLNIR